MNEDIKITFIIPKDRRSENECSEEMQMAFTACKQHSGGGLHATWAHEINWKQFEGFSKRDVFVMTAFVGELYEKLRATECGGAIDMEISAHLREYSKSVAGKEQLLLAAAARAFEAIPRQLADNAGLDATSLLNKLRQKHHAGEVWFGVDIQKEDVADNFAACVWEPAVVKVNAITAACEAAAMILTVDETIKNVKAQDMPVAGGMGRGMGRPRMG